MSPVESFGSGIPFGTGGIVMTTGVMVRIAKMVRYMFKGAVKVGGIVNPCIVENIMFDARCFSFEFPRGSDSSVIIPSLTILAPMATASSFIGFPLVRGGSWVFFFVGSFFAHGYA